MSCDTLVLMNHRLYHAKSQKVYESYMRPSSMISYLWVIVASQATKEHATATFSDTSEIPLRGLQRRHHRDERTRISSEIFCSCSANATNCSYGRVCFQPRLLQTIPMGLGSTNKHFSSFTKGIMSK